MIMEVFYCINQYKLEGLHKKEGHIVCIYYSDQYSYYNG